jgi:hypothetical protein
MEVPQANSWSAIFLAASLPVESRSHSFTIRQAKSNARSEIIRDGMPGLHSYLEPFEIPTLSASHGLNRGRICTVSEPSTMNHLPSAISHQP